MNHKVLAIAPIVVVAAMVLTAVAFAIPQQAFANNGHNNSHHDKNNNNNKKNGIDVSQAINQLNNSTSGAVSDNLAQNQADIRR